MSDPQDTREAILEAARRRFLDAGYADVTLRAVAVEVGVDVSLIAYHFGSKHQLFLEALAPAMIPDRRTSAVLADADEESRPRRLLEGVLAVWEGEQGVALRAVLAASPHHPEIKELLVTSVEDVGRQVAAMVDGPDADGRAASYVVQIAGLVYSRYLLRLEPLASMSVEDVVDLLLPAVTWTLRGSGAVPSAASDPDGASDPGLPAPRTPPGQGTGSGSGTAAMRGGRPSVPVGNSTLLSMVTGFTSRFKC